MCLPTCNEMLNQIFPVYRELAVFNKSLLRRVCVCVCVCVCVRACVQMMSFSLNYDMVVLTV